MPIAPAAHIALNTPQLVFAGMSAKLVADALQINRLESFAPLRRSATDFLEAESDCHRVGALGNLHLVFDDAGCVNVG